MIIYFRKDLKRQILNVEVFNRISIHKKSIERTFKNYKHTISEIKNFLDEMCSLDTKVRKNKLEETYCNGISVIAKDW